MAVITLAEAQTMLTAYLAAESAVLSGKSHSMNGRTLTLEDLAEIREGRQEWERKVQSLTDVSTGVRRGFSLATFQ